MRTILLVSLAVLLLAGCASSFGIQVVQGLPEEVYLTFTKGTSVQVGEVYVLYHAQQNSAGEGGGDHSRHGVANPQTSVRHEVGRVRVVSITDETHALVKVLSGTAREGVAVKRADRPVTRTLVPLQNSIRVQNGECQVKLILLFCINEQGKRSNGPVLPGIVCVGRMAF